MISKSVIEGHEVANTYRFIIDTATELADVPTNVAVGSEAWCIENSKKYMLNGSGVWTEVNFKSGGGSGSSSSNLPIHICTSSEYDASTRVPNILTPDENIFYLVPAANGASPNMFIEYIYTNDAWEIFGSVAIDLSGVMMTEDYSSETWTFTLTDGTTTTKKVVIEE